jgi:molecular chaperone DnaK
VEDSGLEPADIQTILMVGGSSRIPAFQQMLARALGKAPVFSSNLDEDVARGAAILAAKEGGELDPRSQLAMMPMPVDVCSHGLGVSTQNRETREMYNHIIIPAQTPVPAHGEDTFSTVEDGQTHVEIKLNEGDFDDLEYVKGIARGTGSLGRAVPKDYPITVYIDFARDGTIMLNAHDGETGAHIARLKVNRPGNLSEAQRSESRTLLSRMEVR